MSDGMTAADRLQVAAGFVLIAGLLAWAVYNLALYFVARRLEKSCK